jgi:predicted DNA-binding ribbon-helix-helix protein
MSGNREVKNLSIWGSRTSTSLEPVFWRSMEWICDRESITITQFVTDTLAQAAGSQKTVASALRVKIILYFVNLVNSREAAEKVS